MNDQMGETGYEDELLSFDQEEEEAPNFEEGEVELAAELLNVSDEQELDEFFGALLRGARGLLRSPAGRKLKELLRNTTRSAVPVAGQASGDDSGELFGIETEGLSPEDRDLEVARRVVRLAGDAAQRLSNAPSGDPAQAARRALIGAAQRHAPGLVSRLRLTGKSGNANGRWIRRGRTIVIFGV